MASPVLEPSVLPVKEFFAMSDATAIKDAVGGGKGSREGTLIEILTKRSYEQRTRILAQYNKLGRDLVQDLKTELKDKNFQDVMVALLTPPDDFLVNQLHAAMAGPGSDENVLTEILCTRSNKELQALTSAYKKCHDKWLHEALESEVSGEYKRLLVRLLKNSREETAKIDPVKIKEMAETLYAAGEKKLGTDENVFVNILTGASFEQIKLVQKEYETLYGHTLEVAIKKEFSGVLLVALSTIVKTAQNIFAYYAEQLDAGIKARGTKSGTLTRVIVSRSEVDLGGIKREYKNLTTNTLCSAVQYDTAGDYEAALVGLIGHD